MAEEVRPMLTVTPAQLMMLHSDSLGADRAAQNLSPTLSTTDLRDEQAIPSDLQGTSKQPNPTSRTSAIAPLIFSTA